MSSTEPAPAERRDYSVRPYRSTDAARFLALYETVWGTSKDRSWFAWRFDEHPSAGGVQMVVAEANGRLIGAEPLVPYRLRVGERTLDAYQPVDWIVHPEHRRRGVFSAMTEHLLDRVADDAAVLFNFPNAALLPGVESFGWQRVGATATRYRVQNVRAVTEVSGLVGSNPASAALADVGTPLVRGGLGLLGWLRSTSDGVAVECVDGVPVETVHEIYAANRPERIHVPRDRAYLRWRFSNPRWETSTYVARRDGDPVASVVAAVERIGAVDVVRLLDVQPMCERTGDPGAVEAVVRTAVTDHADADVLKAAPDSYPGAFRRCGFLRDDVLPASRFSTTTYHAVRPLGRGSSDRTDGTIYEGSTGAYDLADPDDWCLSLGDRDVA